MTNVHINILLYGQLARVKSESLFFLHDDSVSWEGAFWAFDCCFRKFDQSVGMFHGLKFT